VLRGRGVQATSTFVPGTWAHDPALAPLPYDPDEAARLLDAAGWRRPAADAPRQRDGREFRFDILYYAANPSRAQVALLLQDSLRRLGVTADLVPLEWPALLERLRARRFAGLVHGWFLDMDPDPFDFWHSSQRQAGMNLAGYADPEVDGWCEEGRRTFDPERRAAIYRLVQRRLQRDQPFTFLFHADSLVGRDARLRGFRETPTGPWRWFPGAVDWWVPASLQRYPVGAG